MKKTACSPIVNHNAKTITITKAYAKRANTPGTKEFRELANLHKAFPDYDIIHRTAVITADKETHNGLSVPQMEKIIKASFENEDERNKAVEEFNKAKEFYQGNRSYYGKMKSWFLKKYPNYAELDFAS